MADKHVNEEEIEVVELFDEEGQSMLFELLAQIPDGGNMYFLLTSYDETETEESEAPADVFVMQEVVKNGDKMLEPLEDREIMERIFEKFKDMNKDNFDFVE